MQPFETLSPSCSMLMTLFVALCLVINIYSSTRVNAHCFEREEDKHVPASIESVHLWLQKTASALMAGLSCVLVFFGCRR